MIVGVWAEDSYTLDPEQWVNVWLVNYWNKCEFYASCQVKDLAELLSNQDSADPSDFGLELLEAEA